MNDADMPADIAEYLSCTDDGDIVWRVSKYASKVGSIAGSSTGRGYRQIKFRGKRYLAHRISFFMENGWLPEQVDHIDGDTTNNRPENLRAVTHSQNMINRKTQKNNAVGRTGVDFMKKNKKWRAQIHKNGQKIYLGVYDNLIDAVAARIRAEEKYHGEYSRN